MTPIDIQVSRSKVSVEGQSLFFICWGRGALVFYKQLYLDSMFVSVKQSSAKKISFDEDVENRISLNDREWTLCAISTKK